MKYGEKSIFRVRKEYLKTLTEYQLNQEDVRVFKIITENQVNIGILSIIKLYIYIYIFTFNLDENEDLIFIVQYIDYENIKKNPNEYTY